MLPRDFPAIARIGFTNRVRHSLRRRRVLRSHPESLDSNHRLSPHPLHKTMSGPGEKDHSGRPGPKNPEFASSASFGGDDKARHPSGAMKRGVRANTESAPPSAPAGMDGEQSSVNQWIMGAHLRPAAGGQPRNPKRKVDYFASMHSGGSPHHPPPRVFSFVVYVISMMGHYSGARPSPHRRLLLPGPRMTTPYG